MKQLTELLSDDPFWPQLRGWLDGAARHVEVLEPLPGAGGRTLVGLQVTTRSTLGTIAFETGGLLVDHGWLRVLGSGHPRLPRNLVDWNLGRTWSDASQPAPLLLVADDVLGGLFAINGGLLPGDRGEMAYYAPDTLQWEGLGIGYSAFMDWILRGDLDGFYGGLRWPNWPSEVRDLTGDHAFLIYPFLWAEGPAIADRSRSSVPMAELYELQRDMARQLKGEVRNPQ